MNIPAATIADEVIPERDGTPVSLADVTRPVEMASADPAQLTVHMPVVARGMALTILATVAVIFTLKLADQFFVPLLIGIIIAYALNPLVVWLERIKIPRAMATCFVMLALLGAGMFGTIALRDQVVTILEVLPEAASKISARLLSLRQGRPNTMQKVQAAAREIEKAATQAVEISSAPKVSATHIVIEQPAFKVGDFLRTHSLKAFEFITQVTVVLILIFFLLLAGDKFKRKLVQLTGPSLSKKKITVQILDDINRSIQNYMFTILVANVLLALFTWLAFRWIGLENAGAWAVAAGVMHVIPYFGPLLIAVATGMAGFMYFNSIWMALLVSGSSVVIATVVGMFVVTVMTGKVAKMNTTAVFISLLFWAWVWGVWGLLLAIPLIVIVKVISQHVEELKPLAALLGE